MVREETEKRKLWDTVNIRGNGYVKGGLGAEGEGGADR